MSQANVLKFLEKQKKWIRTKEISKKMKLGQGSISVNLNKLHNQGLIMKKEAKSNFYGCYKWKIR